jgi:rod shape determining protein RodA
VGILTSSEAQDFQSGESSRFDWRLIGAMVGIMIVGLVNIYSAGAVGANGAPLVYRQLLHFLGGSAVIGIVMIFDYRLFERLAYVLYGINLVALMLVEVFGSIRYGARRWLDLGFMSYQPSETMKLATLLALARYFQSVANQSKLDFKDLVVPGLIMGVPALLTIIQPDLGTGGHLAIAGFVILLFMGIRTRVLVTALIVAVVSFPIAWQYGLKPYQRDRIHTFLDPAADPKNKGYNALQSMIAVGSGQVVGKGFTRGTQTQLQFTPEGHTDFIFTVLAEEWGLVGCLILFGLYIYLFHRCITIASLARDKFGAILCVGIIGMLASQMFINVAMVTGMFPIVGIPLPLTSYGGTSVITVCLALGLLLNVGYRRTIF